MLCNHGCRLIPSKKRHEFCKILLSDDRRLSVTCCDEQRGCDFGGDGASLALADLSKDAKRFAGAAKANAMIDAYASDVADFERVCALHGLAALPAEPQTVGGTSPPSPSRARRFRACAYARMVPPPLICGRLRYRRFAEDSSRSRSAIGSSAIASPT